MCCTWRGALLELRLQGPEVGVQLLVCLERRWATGRPAELRGRGLLVGDLQARGRGLQRLRVLRQTRCREQLGPRPCWPARPKTATQAQRIVDDEHGVGLTTEEA